MVKTALYVHMEAKPGKEAEVQKFLEDGLALVNQEPATTAWFAMAMGHGHFGSSMPSPTKPAATPTSTAPSPPR